jgi:MOSC domain-containing protein YiiM
MGRLAAIARREKKRAPMETLECATISEQTGVADDFRGKPGNRQVSLLSAHAWQAACLELGQEIPWTTRRSNLLIEDLDLSTAAGQIIVIGEVRLRITMEVDPCSRMQEQAPGLKRALQPDWRGGVACIVLQGGEVAIGDAVSLMDAD